MWKWWTGACISSEDVHTFPHINDDAGQNHIKFGKLLVYWLVSKHGHNLNYGIRSRNNHFYTKTKLKEHWDVIAIAKINPKSVDDSKMEWRYRNFDVTNANFQRNCSSISWKFAFLLYQLRHDNCTGSANARLYSIQTAGYMHWLR